MSWLDKVRRWARETGETRRARRALDPQGPRPGEIRRLDGMLLVSGAFDDRGLGRILFLAQHRQGTDLASADLRGEMIDLSPLAARGRVRLDLPGADNSGGTLACKDRRQLSLTGNFTGMRIGHIRNVVFDDACLDRIWLDPAHRPGHGRTDLGARNCTLRNANLSGAARLDLHGCDVTGAKLGTGQNLIESRLWDCTGTDSLTLVGPDGAALTDASLNEGWRSYWRQGRLHLLDGADRDETLKDREGQTLLRANSRNDNLGYLLHHIQTQLDMATPRLDLRGRDVALGRLTGIARLHGLESGPIPLDLPGADMRGAELTHYGPTEGEVSGDFTDTIFGDVRKLTFVDSRLDGARFESRMSVFAPPLKARNSSLRGTDLRGLREAELAGCDLAGAILSTQQNLSAFKFTDCTGLDQVNLRDAEDRPIPDARLNARGEILFADGSLRLPDGLTLRAAASPPAPESGGTAESRAEAGPGSTEPTPADLAAEPGPKPDPDIDPDIDPRAPTPSQPPPPGHRP